MVAQVCDDVRHAQAPAVQSIEPQHCTLDVQAARASAQHRVALGDARHDSPAQHDDAVVHALPAAVHIGGLTHTRDALQVRPAPHAAPVAQHAWPDAPHITGGVVHAPEAQVPLAQVVAQRPQLRGSVATSTQAPAQQVSPAPVHVDPAQHASPARRPQVAGGRAQSPD